MEEEKYPWILEILDALTAIYTDIWQKTAENQRKKKKLKSVTNITKWNISQRTAGQDRR